MEKNTILFKDLGHMDYKSAWDYQETLMRANLDIKSQALKAIPASEQFEISTQLPHSYNEQLPSTTNYLLFVEHDAVYTLGKSGKKEHVLIDEDEREERGIQFFHTNRGGDITFHGPGQIVGYPILDLEKFYTDIGRYLRELEEIIIMTLSEYGIQAGSTLNCMMMRN